MIRHRPLITTLGVFVLLLANYGGAQDAPKEKKTNEPNYYPLQVGNTWTYRLIVNGAPATMITKIAKLETLDGISLARLEASVGGDVPSSEHLRQTEKGIFRHRKNGIVGTPPLLLLKYPVKNGDKWEGAFTAAESKANYSCEAQEETVDVPAGKFKTVRVAVRLEEKGKVTLTMSYWFAQDVGVVKQQIDAGKKAIVIELQKFDRSK